MAVHAARTALALVHDPLVAAIKFARPQTEASRHELDRRCAAMLRHVRRLVLAAYGVDASRPFWAVHPPGDPLNCLVLTHDEAAARDAASWWAGREVVVTRVTPETPDPERFLAMAVALHWAPPPWLESKIGIARKQCDSQQPRTSAP